MIAAVVVLATSLGSATGDGVLDDLDDAFASLRAGDHQHARWSLERATRSFDDLALDGGSLEAAFVSDATKPYRGRPHERVLALTMLAALDIERHRCDLAMPALRDAAFNDLKRSKGDVSDAVVVHALLLRCLVTTHALDADVARARADLHAVAGERAADIERAAVADDAALSLDGEGPAYDAAGNNGERAVVVAVTKPDKRVARIRLGPKASSQPSLSTEGIAVWSSMQQATTVQGRPFDEVLAERARAKDTYNSAANARLQQARTTAQSRDLKNPRGALANAATTFLLASTGAGLAVAGAATDARADLRSVDGLFERVVLVGDGGGDK